MYKYPYGDSQQLNLDWILAKLKELEASGGSGEADLEEVSNALISLTYNTSTAYRRYDYAFLNGKLYRCLTDTSGVFDPPAWQEALIGDDLSVLTRWINAIDAAAVVDVKFDTSGTNGKIQKKYHDQYHDVVEVDYTPVQNSKRPLSSNAGYELNGAILPITGTTRVETQANLISKSKFWHAGNNIALASGVTLEAYARGVTISNDGDIGCIIGIGYGGRAYFAFFTGGAFVNARLVDMEQVAKIMKSTTATEALSVGDYRIISNTLYRITQAISNGGTLTLNTNCVVTTVADELKNAVNLQSTTVSLSNKNTAARLDKQGHIVTLNSPEDFTSAVATTLTKIGTLPSGYIPKEYFRVPFCNVNLSGGGLAFVEVHGEANPDPGGIYYYYPRASSGATNGSFFASYVVN